MTGTVLSASCPVSQVPQYRHRVRDGGVVTGGDGWDSCHSYCGNLIPPYGEWLGSGTVRPLCRGEASSEAEMTYPLEGRFATLERGEDAGRSRGVSTGTLE